MPSAAAAAAAAVVAIASGRRIFAAHCLCRCLCTPVLTVAVTAIAAATVVGRAGGPVSIGPRLWSRLRVAFLRSIGAAAVVAVIGVAICWVKSSPNAF